ncbi:hypothetical protein BC936DRAFT_136845 [Jimgerdemannia flammicorona]|nr:hypothetical protein BC936DRAFT_136845 [Jimgerdemannia flammicorona]
MWPFSGARKNAAYVRLSPRRGLCFSPFKIAALLGVMGIVVFFSVAQLQLNLRVYLREWISHEEDRYYEPLHGCFDNVPADSPYYSQDAVSFKHDIAAGIPLTDGWECFDFASTIKSEPTKPREHIIYHTYWRADLLPIGDKQISALRSVYATQNINYTTIYLWSNGDLTNSRLLMNLKNRVGESLQLRHYKAEELAKDTPMDGSPNLVFNDQYAYLDGDLIRLLALYKYGGMWFDMDSLFIRDMSPLFEREWVSQWDCFLPRGYPFNGAFMRFRKDSPYVCEMLTEMATGPLPRKKTIDWGGYMYYRVYRRLLANGRMPFDIVPWCFSDPVSCHPYNSMPKLAEESKFDKRRLMQVFAYHWHNQWNKSPGTVFRYLDELHKDKLKW